MYIHLYSKIYTHVHVHVPKNSHLQLNLKCAHVQTGSLGVVIVSKLKIWHNCSTDTYMYIVRYYQHTEYICTAKIHFTQTFMCAVL